MKNAATVNGDSSISRGSVDGSSTPPYQISWSSSSGLSSHKLSPLKTRPNSVTPKAGILISSQDRKEKGKAKQVVSFSPSPYVDRGSRRDKRPSEEEETVGKKRKLATQSPPSSVTRVEEDSLPQIAPGCYGCRPTSQEIDSLPQEKKAAVHNFTIYRQDYGDIKFLLPVDLRGISDIIETIKTKVVIDKSMFIIHEPALMDIPVLARLQLHPSLLSDVKDSHGNIDTGLLESKLRSISKIRHESYDPETNTWAYTRDA